MSTTSLPLELLGVIVVLCPKLAFPALCRTCKTFRDIIEPLLYHDICLSGHDAQADEIFHRIVGLYETLKSNREKASMVQKVEILELSRGETSDRFIVPDFKPVLYTPEGIPGQPYLSTISQAIVAVLAALPDLTVFHLTGDSEELEDRTISLNLLEYVSLPSLCEFHLDVTKEVDWSTPRMALHYFLQRHLQLKRVILRIHFPAGIALVRKPWTMPNLEWFEAPAAHLEGLKPDTPLKHVSANFRQLGANGILVHYETRGLPVLLDTFQPLTTLRSLTVAVRNQDLPVASVKTISEKLPGLEALEVRHINYLYTLSISMNEIAAVGEALSRFNYLRRLSFTCGLPFIGTVDDRNEDIDHKTVVTWGEACPTLQYCATYKSVWERIGDAWARSSP